MAVKWFAVLNAVLGMIMSVLDVGLDIWTAVTFYQEEAYWRLGLFVVILLVTSVLVQIISWLMYGETSEEEQMLCTNVSRAQLKLLHVLQLGTFFRYVGIVEAHLHGPKDIEFMKFTQFLSEELSILRVVETFSESAPQLVLMATINLQHEEFDLVTGLKALVSAVAIAISVTSFHCTVRYIRPIDKQQPWSSTAVYFLWNALLLLSRASALALFASVLPYFIVVHFICSWMIFFFCAWRAQTNITESACAEWVYRGTLGLIWYFNWFEVVCRDTRNKTVLYHGFILTDIVLLCSLWAWKMSTEQHSYDIAYPYTIITPVCVVAIYSLGLFVAKMYYVFCHEKLTENDWNKVKLCSVVSEQPAAEDRVYVASVSARGKGPSRKVQIMSKKREREEDASSTNQPAADSNYMNSRMRKMAVNFYS